jgi:FtsP/CotA-like multicopper oxidase with cupredoxin domain
MFNLQPPRHISTLHNTFRAEAQARTGQAWTPGSAVFQYENDQDAATLWYHDHTLGMTRLNVYAGPAGFYLIRGGDRDLPSGILPGPAPALGDPPGKTYYEIPIAIQDRSFNADGSLFYPTSREFFDGFAGPYIPNSDVPPIWNPELFCGYAPRFQLATMPVGVEHSSRCFTRSLSICV